jgi:hypothetical protein
MSVEDLERAGVTLPGDQWDGAKCNDPEDKHGKQARCRNPLRIANLEKAPRDGAGLCGNAPPGTRTQDPLIKSQLLCQLS